MTPNKAYSKLLEARKTFVETQAAIEALEKKLAPLYEEASKKYQKMLRGAYRDTPIEDIPCPCCGAKSLKVRDAWIHTINECTYCGWSTSD